MIATTEAEKEEIYRLRYEVYIEEMDGARRHTEVDTSRRRMRDDLDDEGVQFYIRQKGRWSDVYVPTCGEMVRGNVKTTLSSRNLHLHIHPKS
jgi:hypothetical protein